MNKGFAYYFRQAFKISAKTVWKNKNLLKSVLYFFTSLVARLTVILGAMVSLADVRQAKIAKNQQKIDIPQSFNKASQKPLWTMVVASVLEFLMYIGGFLLVSIVCGAIFGLGLIIAEFVGRANYSLICIIFAVPCLIIYAVYTIIVLIMFAPTAYVIDSNPSISAGDAVSVCISSMKYRGKTTTFMCVFIPALIIGAVAGVCAGGFALVISLFAGNSLIIPLMLLWGIVSAVLLGLTVPTFNMTGNLALVLLYEDIALDPVNAQKRTAGINIKKISGARVDREEIADNLTALFDEEISEKYPEPEELIHKHKKKKKTVNRAPAPAAQTANAQAQPAEEAQAQFEEEDDYPEDAPASAPAQEQAAQPAQAQSAQQTQQGAATTQQPFGQAAQSAQQPVQRPAQAQPTQQAAPAQQPFGQAAQPAQQPVQRPAQAQSAQQAAQPAPTPRPAGGTGGENGSV